MNQIIQKLKRVRQEKGLKQSELGSKLGLPQSHISKIEQGLTDPRLSTVMDMARLLEQELVMVPRNMLTAVGALIDDSAKQAPRWQPDEEDGET